MVKWKRLEPPPETATAILGIGYTTIAGQSVYVETTSGNRYVCCNSNLGGWTTAKPEDYYHKMNCQVEGYTPGFPITNLPGEVMDCTWVSQWEWVTERLYFALLKDGSLWSWHYRYGMGDYFFYLCGGPFLGFFIGVVISVWMWRRGCRNNYFQV